MACHDSFVTCRDSVVTFGDSVVTVGDLVVTLGDLVVTFAWPVVAFFRDLGARSVRPIRPAPPDLPQTACESVRDLWYSCICKTDKA